MCHDDEELRERENGGDFHFISSYSFWHYCCLCMWYEISLSIMYLVLRRTMIPSSNMYIRKDIQPIYSSQSQKNKTEI